MSKELEAAEEYAESLDLRKEYEALDREHGLEVIFPKILVGQTFLAGIAWERHRAACERVGLEEEKE